MGTDIHFYVEHREGDKWITADTWADSGWGPDNYANAFFSQRSYDTFAILANVRNGSGFAGVDTGNGFTPIAEPRGFPDDTCPEVRTVFETCGGHSESWLLLSELLAYDWTQTTKKRGWVNVQEWGTFHHNKRSGPESWCSMISGGQVKHLSNQDFENAWTAITTLEPAYRYQLAWHNDKGEQLRQRMAEQLGGGNPVCQLEWEVTYYQAASSFWSETMPRLLRIGSPENVRCVFFFDS